MQSFRAKLEPVPHGGHYVAVPAEVAAAAGLRHAARVTVTIEADDEPLAKILASLK